MLVSTGSCATAIDPQLFEALCEGSAPDGRQGLELYAPDSRAAVLDRTAEAARYWARGPEANAELDRILARHDPASSAGRAARFLELTRFLERNVAFTETAMQPGLHDLRVDGDRALAYRIGVNPGGEFREAVRFVRIGGLWYRVE